MKYIIWKMLVVAVCTQWKLIMLMTLYQSLPMYVSLLDYYFWCHQNYQFYYYIRVNLYSFLVLVVFSPPPSIFSALLENSKKVSFQRGFARYLLAISSTCADSPNFYDLRLLRVPVQGVNILVVLGEIAIDIKNNVIRQ